MVEDIAPELPVRAFIIALQGANYTDGNSIQSPACILALKFLPFCSQNFHRPTLQILLRDWIVMIMATFFR
jgi:hypothetical protein